MYFKKNYRNLILIFSFPLLISACASSGVHRGVIAMKISETQAHVGVGGNEVSAGDHVELFRNVCTGGGKEERGPRSCRKENLGHGIVNKVINDEYSEVEFPAGTTFAEGDTIEKHAH